MNSCTPEDIIIGITPQGVVPPFRNPLRSVFALPYITSQPERDAGFVAVAPLGLRTHRAGFERIAAPVLTIWGEHDRLIPLSDAETLVKSVQHGKLVVIPNGSHAPYMNDPGRFNEELSKFVAECSVPKV